MSVLSRSVGRGAMLATIVGALVVLGTGLAVAGERAAGGLDTNDEIVLTGHLDVGAGQTVDTAVILNGPAVVDGTVNDALVVVNGSTVVSGTVHGDVVVVNGSAVIRSSAVIDGDLVTGNGPRIEAGATIRGEVKRISRLDWTRFRFAWRMVWWVAYSGSSLLLGLLLMLFAPRLDGLVVDAVRTRAGAALGFGAAVFFLVPIGAGLLLITVVGIPLSLFVFLALALLYSIGYALGAHSLGRALVRPPTSRFLAFLAGWAILRVVALVPFVGGAAWLLASVFGLGALVAASRRPAEPAAAPALPGPPLP